MHVASDDENTSALDSQSALPGRNKSSIALVLGVQALNSFNDNFVKMLLIALAITVAKGTALGDNMEILLVAFFSLPYVLFGPIAGWWSDRASKKQVIVWMQVAQLLCLALLAGILLLRDPYWSLLLSLGGFFLLATQAAFLSPAKIGVMKELAGSRRLGSVSGWLQMTMMAGVLSGIFAGGEWYGNALERTGDPWMSALWPLVIIGILAVGELVAAMCMQATPEHPEVKFHRSLLWEHFGQARMVFKHRPVRMAALGIIYFWFVANSIGLIVVTLAKEMNPDATSGGGPMEVARLASMLGVGVVAGSLLAGAICRRRIELGLIPVAGLGMVAGLLVTGLAPLGSAGMYAGLVFTGIAGGCFMVPLYAYVQDRAVPSERARILAGINLLNCLGVFVVAAVVFGMKAVGLSASQQFVALAFPTFLATAYTTRLLPQDFVRFVCVGIVRTAYKVRAVNPGNVPRTGGVLLLPNHISYVDALVISVACDRPVRFVMWDTLYKVWWMNGFLRLFGTVPISATRAKDAIRTVADALKNGECVCIFPEGQLTRVGMLNEVRKGYELMARQADVPVVPVYQDGLWGSVFSHEGRGVFRKLPKKLRFPVTIAFGQPIPAKEAKAEKVREAILALGSETILMRKPDADLAEMNRLRLDSVPVDDPMKRYVDPATGAVIAVHLPNPVMPKGSTDIQLGTLEGAHGRLLPGLAVRATADGLLISGLAPGMQASVMLPGATLDASGFIVPPASSTPV